MPSKLGIHAILSGGTIGALKKLKAAGAKMTTVKAVEGIGMLADVKKINPETVTVGRYMKGADGHLVESPPLDGDLRKTARRVLDNLLPKWEPHRQYVDFWEITNEMDPAGPEGHGKLGELFVHFIEFANQEGYKLAMFGYSLGVPEWEEIEAIVNTGVFSAAKAGGHALALHEYAYPMQKWYGEPLPGKPTYPNRGSLACRYRWWYEDFLIPRDEVVPLFLTEANLGLESRKVEFQEWMDQITWYDERLREDYYVIGAHLFTLGSAGGQWRIYDFEAWVPMLVDYMISIKDTSDPTWDEPIVSPSPGEEEPPVESDTGAAKYKESHMCKPREPYGRHYLLFPPQADWTWIAAAERYWTTFKPTIGTSADDAAYGPGLTERVITVVNPQWWPEDIHAFFEQYYPGVTFDPVYAESPAQLKAILERRVVSKQRFG
ncbi:MAG: hypothetical protein JW981_10810 [Anaerolineae bacterium]|nr:hypothetical protein [Anaerolineae bacterium]